MGFFDWNSTRQIIDDYQYQREEALRNKLALIKWSRTMQMEKKFCVIGECSGNKMALNRTWCATEDQAIAHAASLLRERSDVKLYVVEVKKVVQTKADYEVLSID